MIRFKAFIAIQWILFSSIFFNISIYAKISFEKQILDLKIKAITSVELSSLSFDELPSLYFLFDTLTTKRFESVYKNDPKKFEEFKKIHQYYGIKTSFYSLKLKDATVFDEFNAEELEVMSNKINWTDQEITKFGFIGKDKNGKFKFHEKVFADFFLSQYFHDNIIHPNDTPTDDEMELRLRFFIYIIGNNYEQFPIFNEFNIGMLNSQTGDIFSDQIRMLMKYKFNNLLDPFLPQDWNNIEKISMVFSKDKEVLSNLWGIDQNQPYFLRHFERSFNYRFDKLKAIAEKYFDVGNVEANITSNSTNLTSKPKALNMFRGKNQILNILYTYHQRKNENLLKDILNITKYQVSDETLQKLNETENFLDFVDSSSYSLDDKKEFFISNAHHLIGISWKADKLKNLWSRMEKYFAKNEMKILLTQKDRHFNHTHLFEMSSSSDYEFVEAFLNLTRIYLNPAEIKDFLSQRRPISRESFLVQYLSVADSSAVYEMTYNFAKEFLTHDELKDLIFNYKDTPFIQKVTDNDEMFNISTKILSEFYSKEEIQDMLMMTDNLNRNIIFWAVDALTPKAKPEVAKFVKEVFKGREDKLKEMFKVKDKLYEKNAFEVFKSLNYKEKFQPFLDLAKEIFTEEEIKELVKEND